MIANNNNGTVVVDGVQRSPENGIKVVIIGAGVAGLQTALECWRKGCDVVVLERADKLSPLGDYFTITPSALTTLKEYPYMYADYHRNIYNCSVHVYYPSGVPIYSTVPEWKVPGVKTNIPEVDVSFLKRRAVFAQMQLDQLERLSIPVHWGEKVVEVREGPDSVSVTTASGKQFMGDVCVGANGVGSSIPGFETGPENAVLDSGFAIARVAFPRTAIKEGSPASTLFKTIDIQPEFRAYVGKGAHLMLMLTNDWVAYAFTHPDSQGAEESWSNLKQTSELIPYIEKSADGWDPAVLDFIRSGPTSVVDWKLRLRDGTPQWTSDGGRLIRVGDAAHTFLPTAANGAVQGMEDALALAECLNIGGKKGVPQATKVHNKLRFERVSILQQTGFLNQEELHTALEAIQKDKQNANKAFAKMGRWVWNHDAVAYARENYAACLAHLTDGKPFENTNLPPGHVYEPWNLESETKRIAAGIKSDLKLNGDWSP